MQKVRRLQKKLLIIAALLLFGVSGVSLFFPTGIWAGSTETWWAKCKKAGLPHSIPDKSSPMVDLSKFKKKKPPYVIGYSSPGVTNSWQHQSAAQIKWAVDQEMGGMIKKYYWTNAKESIPKQIADVEDLLTKGIDALVIATVNTEALNRTLRKVIKAGVPVILHERSVSDPNAYTVWMSLDNTEQGRIQFRFMAEQLGGKGNIVIMHGLPGIGPVVDQSKGYAEIHKKYPGIKILATEYTNYSRQLGKTKMENVLQAYPKIDGVLCNSGLEGIGVFEAVKESGRLDQIKAWTGDDIIGWLKLVHNNKLKSAIAPIPTWGIVGGLYASFDILQGKPSRKVWQMPSARINFTDIPGLGVLNLPDDLWLSPISYDVVLKYMKNL